MHSVPESEVGATGSMVTNQCVVGVGDPECSGGYVIILFKGGSRDGVRASRVRVKGSRDGLWEVGVRII